MPHTQTFEVDLVQFFSCLHKLAEIALERSTLNQKEQAEEIKIAKDKFDVLQTYCQSKQKLGQLSFAAFPWIAKVLDLKEPGPGIKNLSSTKLHKLEWLQASFLKVASAPIQYR